MKKEQFKFNLQLFGNEGEPEPSENTPEMGTGQESQEQTSFTQEQVDEIFINFFESMVYLPRRRQSRAIFINDITAQSIEQTSHFIFIFRVV